jgi:hypothetical protein
MKAEGRGQKAEGRRQNEGAPGTGMKKFEGRGKN